ncbi:MAG: hypothetical protein FGM46_06885 [Ferruginibacter sp.]|nr:hypothetical protein [Ferruginibacter sp.]
MKTIKIIFFLLFFLPVYGISQDVYEVKWGPQQRYKGALVIDEEDGSGTARIKWDGNMVEQTLTVDYTNEVLRVDGSYPVYPGTSDAHESYNADNFYITIDNLGKYSCINIDDANSTSKCSLRKINGNLKAKNKFLKEFDMTVDY